MLWCDIKYRNNPFQGLCALLSILYNHEHYSNNCLPLTTSQLAILIYSNVDFVNDDHDFQWVDELKEKMKNSNQFDRLWLVADDNKDSGIIGFMSCLMREPHGDSVR